MQSALWKRIRKAAIERAGGRCEGTLTLLAFGQHEGVSLRCPTTEKLHAHHKHYSLRFGGNETDEDLIVLCVDCHRSHHVLQGKRI